MREKFNQLFDVLIDHQLATKEEIVLVCCINGHNLESLESILYARTLYRSLEQYMESEYNMMNDTVCRNGKDWDKCNCC